MQLKREPSGRISRENRIGPRTEPWGTSHVSQADKERYWSMATEKLVSDKWEVNQSRAVHVCTGAQTRQTNHWF